MEITASAMRSPFGKKVGAELMEDTEIGPMVIQPLKMKGVEEFGDYSTVLSFGMTTLPGMKT